MKICEAVPMDIRKEIKTKAYKKTINKDINNIETYETRTKVNATNGGQSMKL